jgi:hypothetical protein
VKKTTRITVETRRVLVISGGGSIVQWCAACHYEVRMLTAEEASVIANIKTRIVYQWVEKGLVHFSEERDGSLLICINSLLERRGVGSAQLMPQVEGLNAEPRG